MTTELLLNSINSWATDRGLNFTAESLPAPPPFLDARSPIQNPAYNIQNSPDTSGICLTIREPEPTGQPPAQLGIWIPSIQNPSSKIQNSPASYCMMQEGDGEISTCTIENPESNIQDPSILLPKIESLCRTFYHDFVFVPALESWLGKKGIKYAVITPKEFRGDAAAQGDCTEWFFVEFKTPPPEEYDTILGVSGDGQAATFTAEGDGFLDFDEQIMGLKNASELKKWLDERRTP